MRGEANPQPNMFSYVDLESRIPQTHPIRKIRRIVDIALNSIEPYFDDMYANQGRPSIPPEQLLRALLLQILFTVRSERQLMERIDYDLLFRWFVGLGIDDKVWNHSTFSKNRDRLLSINVDELFFESIKDQAYSHQLLSHEHFSVDGTLLEACAGIKSFKAKADTDNSNDDDPPQDGDFHGKSLSNETHECTTDSDARLFRKGKNKEAKLRHMGHLLTENRNGLIVEATVTEAGTSQEWEAGTDMLSVQSTHPGLTVGGDKGYDTPAFVEECRRLKITPHVAAKEKGSQIDLRTTRHAGYEISQRKRKQIEECFGWMKTIGLLGKLRHRGKEKVDWIFRFTAAAYNITRMKALLV